ncbi:MAG: hypothetical protein LBC39_01540 [Methanobrevibacter sp.]|jgi:hypothetical protein|nr:hypothetical protein [Candidatus Methanovirga aequatorialis]
MEKSITYFETTGKINTDELIKIVKNRIERSNIKYVAIASASGESALKLAEELSDVTIINVTHHSGFREPNVLDISDEMRKKLEDKGVITYVGSHALSGVGRGITNKFGGITPVEIISATLRILSQGIKVCVEIGIMLSDAGIIPVNEEILAIGGTGKGIDTGIILSPANSANVFDLKIHEILAMPRP